MNPTIKTGFRCTFHRDGTVSFWNVLGQCWERRPALGISSDLLATLNDTERAAIAKHAAR